MGTVWAVPQVCCAPAPDLSPFGPGALVYDVFDTDGKLLPEDVSSFVARGAINDAAVHGFRPSLTNKGINLSWVD